MGKSSKDKRDAYYRLAKEQSWRARSAFKLLQLDEQFDIFTPDVLRVVDLCAAPGSWSQVLSRMLIKGECLGRRAWEEKYKAQRKEIFAGLGELEEEVRRIDEQSATTEEFAFLRNEQQSTDTPPSKLKPRKGVKIVAVDLQPIAPLEGVTSLVADITHPTTIPRILQALDSGASSHPEDETHQHSVDLVLSDGAPDVTGLHDLDMYIQSELVTSALSLAKRVLKPGGKFIAKIFRAKDTDLLYSQLRWHFAKVTCAKPRSSRASSLEAFIVCEGFQRLDPEQGQQGAGSWLAPFLACGDLDNWPDADATQHLPEGHVSLDPVRPPVRPPYQAALEERRRKGGFYGKTKTKPDLKAPAAEAS